MNKVSDSCLADPLLQALDNQLEHSEALTYFLTDLSHRMAAGKIVLRRCQDNKTEVLAMVQKDSFEEKSRLGFVSEIRELACTGQYEIEAKRQLCSFTFEEVRLLEDAVRALSFYHRNRQSQERVRVLSSALEQTKQQSTKIQEASSYWESRYLSLAEYTNAVTRKFFSWPRELESLLSRHSREGVAEFETELANICSRHTKTAQALYQQSSLRARDPKLEPVNLNFTLFQVLEELEAPIKENRINLKRSRLPNIVGDPDLWKLLLKELISNACHHTGRGSTVSLEVEETVEYFHFVLTDDGPGVPEDHLSKVLEPFFKVLKDGHEQHSGLGLHTCTTLLERLGGRLWLSTPQGGRGLAVHWVVPVQRLKS